MFGLHPISPLFQGDCTSSPDPNPYFPDPAATWMPRAPFWFRAAPGGPCAAAPAPNWPVGDPDDYKWDSLPRPVTGETLLQVFEIDRPERYLPGEIYKNELVKRPIEDLSKTADCQKKWVPKDPGFYSKFQPSQEMMNPPLILDGVLRRKAETNNSYLIPHEAVVEETCEGVEDLETKNKKRPDFLAALKYANTRPDDYECEPDTKVRFKDACKVPDTSVKVTSGMLRKMWRPDPEDPPEEKSQDDCRVCK